ncbi:MAG: zinc ribbon domain-containing protein, partial [Thermosynechococcus sp. Uc]
MIYSECLHPNPVGAVQCKACFSPMPIMTSCPNCGAPVQPDASFCGQCGFNLRRIAVSPPPIPEVMQHPTSAAPTVEVVAHQRRLTTLPPPPTP